MSMSHMNKRRERPEFFDKPLEGMEKGSRGKSHEACMSGHGKSHHKHHAGKHGESRMHKAFTAHM